MENLLPESKAVSLFNQKGTLEDFETVSLLMALLGRREEFLKEFYKQLTFETSCYYTLNRSGKLPKQKPIRTEV